MEQEIQRFIKALKILISATTNKRVPILNTDITLDDFISVFKKTKESTTSSPSGIHYGHYINTYESEELAEVDLLFIVTPFKLEIPLIRWTKILHCTI